MIRYLIAVEGKETKDRRLFTPGSLLWERLPVPVTELAPPEYEGAEQEQTVASILAVSREGDRIWADVEPALGLTTALAINIEILEGEYVDVDAQDGGPPDIQHTITKAQITGATITTRKAWAWDV